MSYKNKVIFKSFCVFPDIALKIKNNFKYLMSLLCILIGILFLPKIAYMASISPEGLIELTNIERERNGMDKLTVNHLLTQAAAKKASAIFEAQTFQHNISDKKFSNWVQEAGYQYSYIGENLAMDFTAPESIIKAWLGSEPHKKNLLNVRFTEIGIAVAEGKFDGEATIVVVQIFGEPINAQIGKVSGTDLSCLYYQDNYPDVFSANKMVLSVNENFENKHELLLLSLLNSIEISTSTNLNDLLALINRDEIISSDKNSTSFYSNYQSSALMYWEKNITFSNLIFLITAIIIIFSVSFFAAPALMIYISYFYYKFKSSPNHHKHSVSSYYKHKI